VAYLSRCERLTSLSNGMLLSTAKQHFLYLYNAQHQAPAALNFGQTLTMDPLSPTASVIALISIGNQLAKGISKLGGAPALILSLNNELSDIRLVLAETEALLAEHETRDTNHALSISRPSFEKRMFPSLKNVWDRMQELQAIEKRLTTRSGGIDRLAWLWEQDNVNKAQNGLRASRSDVVAVLGLISSLAS